jgi:hypothetical protein
MYCTVVPIMVKVYAVKKGDTILYTFMIIGAFSKSLRGQREERRPTGKVVFIYSIFKRWL